MLATLFKDERCQSLSEFPILEKMYLDRIIRPNEIAQLDAMLQPHQKAKTIDGNNLHYSDLTLIFIESFCIIITSQIL